MGSTTIPALAVDGLRKVFRSRSRRFLRVEEQSVAAVQDVSFGIAPGEVVGLVGESGCGKTTVARMIMLLETPTAGEIRLGGDLVRPDDRHTVARYRKAVQMVFQDPYASVNPRMTVEEIVAEPLRLQRPDLDRAARRKAVAQRLDEVSLSIRDRAKRADEFSGGQLQRVGIARALALDPDVLICDEPVSALDVSIQAQVLNLLAEIRTRRGVSMLFISHDLSVIRHLCSRTLVMYLGRIMEMGQTPALLSRPRHPYTKALISSEPQIDLSAPRGRARPERVLLAGDPPSASNPPSGCVFRTRCWQAREECAASVPQLSAHHGGRFAACHFPLEG